MAAKRAVIRSVAAALVACAAAFAGGIGAREAIAVYEQRAAAAAPRATETRKTHEINVPRIKNGAVKGYAVMMLSYTVDVGAMKTAAMAPDSILVDEAFRYVYNDDTIDFDHIDRFDFAKMSKELMRLVNARVKGEVVVDVGVQEFTYAAIADTHSRP
jgi:hypothetical protein